MTVTATRRRREHLRRRFDREILAAAGCKLDHGLVVATTILPSPLHAEVIDALYAASERLTGLPSDIPSDKLAIYLLRRGLAAPR